ncbi:MAG: alpha/beta fold hydrolase [Rickettsiales bacterium]|jgi:phospholipase/carboxylesterase|nr:alpha/beta fold hydrolase [Rickettsiales bacterium]
MLDFVERPARSGKDRYVIFLLHGLGDSGEAFISLSEYFYSISEDICFIAPDAPQQMSPGSYRWFALTDMAAIAEAIEESHGALCDFVDAQIVRRGTDSENVFLVGFSQGAMMSLYAGLRLNYDIGGIVSFSGLYPEPLANCTSATRTPQNVLMIHSRGDDVVPYSFLIPSKKLLENFGATVETHSCHNNSGHRALDYDCVRVAVNFIKNSMNSINHQPDQL